MLEAKASFLVCVTWFGFMGGIWALFEAAETSVAVDTKTAVSRWLHNLVVLFGFDVETGHGESPLQG